MPLNVAKYKHKIILAPKISTISPVVPVNALNFCF